MVKSGRVGRAIKNQSELIAEKILRQTPFLQFFYNLHVEGTETIDLFLIDTKIS